MSFFKKSLNIENTPIHAQVRFQSDFLHSLLGCINQGTTVLLEEDSNTLHHITFIKTFIAQNIHHNILIVSKDHSELKIPDYNTSVHCEPDEKLQIAFRYEHLKLHNNERRFDLSKEMSIKDKNLEFVKLDINDNSLLDIMERQKQNTIVILPSFLSPVWHVTNVCSMIYDIKQIVKRNKLILIATIPTILHKENTHLYFDLVFKLHSHTFSNKLVNYYAGILEIKKIYNLQNLKGQIFDTLKFGYFSTKHGLEFENISLPPEKDETTGCSVSTMF